MERSSVIAIAVVALVALAATGAAIIYDESPVDGESKDFAGFEITPVDNLDNGIVAIGQDSFRWITYFGLSEKCVMVDLNDKTNYMGKAFMYVGKARALENNPDLKFTSVNCEVSPGDTSTILDLNPSLVVVPAEFENTHKNDMDSLRAAGLNVFHIGYIYTFLENGTFEMTTDLVRQIDKMSMVLGMEERGEALKSLIDETVDDILSIRDKITDRRTGFICSLAYNGAHGMDSSMSYYMPFELAGITNIMADASGDVDQYSHVGTYSATTIKNNIEDDTILFMDATGIYTCTTNTDRGIMELFKGHEAYIACPYIWTGMNYENVLVGAYQILRDAYGLISDDEFEEKADKIYEGFLGTSDSLRNETASNVPPAADSSVYEDMNRLYEERRGNPIHGEISVDENGITYL